jgi:hypothetical protein
MKEFLFGPMKALKVLMMENILCPYWISYISTFYNS